MSFTTPDLCDANEAAIGHTLRVVTPMFKAYGGRARFCGRIHTLKIFEDNSLVREALGQPGQGKVLVVDGGGSLRCALVGDQLAVLAQKNGWEGIVVYGCIRDSAEINRTDLGCAPWTPTPRKASRRASATRTSTSPSAASPSSRRNGSTWMKTVSSSPPRPCCKRHRPAGPSAGTAPPSLFHFPSPSSTPPARPAGTRRFPTAAGHSHHQTMPTGFPLFH